MLPTLIICLCLTLSGHAEHFEQGKYNEENYGVGIEYNEWSVGTLKDSEGSWSPYAAYAWKLAEHNEWEGGLSITAAYRQNGNYAGYNVAPLPYLRWTDQDSRFGMNIIAAPVDGGFVFFQLRIRLGD